MPALIYSLMCLGLPESPRWLIGRKGDRTGGVEVLRLIHRQAPWDEIESKADEIAAVSHEKASVGNFGSTHLKTPILLAFFIAFFNQLSGINAVLYFAPRIFELTGLEEKAALLQSVGIGVTNLIFTFVGLWLIDRIGRRTLRYIGSFGYKVWDEAHQAEYGIWDTMSMHVRLMDRWRTRLMLKQAVAEEG